jgi:hypothetical protein
MSINYYLFCRESYNRVINSLEDIINIFEEMEKHTQEEDTQEKQSNFKSDTILLNESHNKLFFSSKKQDIQVLKNICDKNILELCKHTFIEDTIDITPDKSQNIRYCSICEYTDPNY